VIVEATAVAPEGRITPKCLGIWTDAHGEKLREIAASIRPPVPCPEFNLPTPAAKPVQISLGKETTIFRREILADGNPSARLRLRSVKT
jgi:hypothetical protein